MDALPDILKALEAAEDSMGDAVDALRQCDKDLTMSAADRASTQRGRWTASRSNSTKLKNASDSLSAVVGELQRVP